MGRATHSLSVMRLPPQTRRPDAPPVRRTLAGTLVLAGLLVVGLLAVSAPAVLAGGFLATAVVTAVLRAVRRYRRLDRGPRRVCVPRTDVCVQA
jgi:predicted lysophospholipase L1 biosynthesis ABC-type transport system permease subunit